MSAPFYWPVWLQFDPHRLYLHTRIKPPLHPYDLPLISLSKGLIAALKHLFTVGALLCCTLYIENVVIKIEGKKCQ